MAFEQRDAAILESYEGGEALADIAKRWDLSRERVRQIVKAAGATMPRQNQQAQIDAAIQAIFEGAKILDAAREHGAAPATIRKHMVDQHGVTPYEVRRGHFAAERESRLRGEGETECVYCGETKSWSEMRVGPRGRQRVCNECNNDKARQWYRDHAGQNPEPTVDEKECTNCGEVKPADEFYRNTALTTGLQSWCKMCHNDWRKET